MIDDPATNQLFMVQEFCECGPVMTEVRAAAPLRMQRALLTHFRASLTGTLCTPCSISPTSLQAEYNTPLPPAVARSYFRDVLQGLEYLHFQRVIHRCVLGGAAS